MEQKHRDLLRKNRMAICLFDFNPVSLAKILQKRKVFSETDKNIISSERNDLKKKEKLLDILQKRGPHAFHNLLEAFDELGLPNVRSLLNGTINTVTESDKAEKKSSKNITSEMDAHDGPPGENKEEEHKDTIDTPRKEIEDTDGRTLFGRKKAKDEKTEADESLTLPKVYPTQEFDLDECYPMDTKPRGVFLLINNKDFLFSSGMESYPRNGTDVDAEAVMAVFKEMGFLVDSHRNLSVYEMRREFKRVANLDYNSLSMVACCVLSHGQEGELYGIDGKIDIRELTSYFRGKNLAGKPKLFFFQACQGSEYMNCVEPDSGHTVVDGPPESTDISLPTEADFLYAYSTVPGYYSWRNSARGSWFIQAMCQVFRRYAHKMDVVRMLTRVNDIVSTKKSQTGQRFSHHKRQISSIITQMRKELYFFPLHGPLEPYSGTF